RTPFSLSVPPPRWARPPAPPAPPAGPPFVGAPTLSRRACPPPLCGAGAGRVPRIDRGRLVSLLARRTRPTAIATELYEFSSLDLEIAGATQDVYLRFLAPRLPVLPIRKSSSFCPPLSAATSHFGRPPRPAQVWPDFGSAYCGATLRPLSDEARPPRPPDETPRRLSCFSSS